ncbi:terminase large subunit [Shimia sp.]|uniref:terminase large subunit n=1 Tax=Shimia sp. TaxID=1954381 RepID=UPI003BADB3AD
MADLDPTSEYARKVLDGEIVAGKYVKLACERHFSDLEAGPERGIYFDYDAAQEAIEFFPAMFTITDGAKAGEPFHLLDWHKFVVGSLFGWYKNGRLRFRSGWLETGKGQAKSPLMGGISLYICGFREIPRAQCYAIASKLDQAKIPFKDGAALCRAEIPEMGESLEARGDVSISGKGENAWRIEFPHNSSFFEAKATTDSLSGPRPDCVIADEVHEFQSVKPIELWEAGIAKKAGSAFMLLGTNTPAIDQIVGTEKSEYYQRLLEGIFDDDEAFAYIARVDDDDDPFQDEECWIKAMPALGITFGYDNVRGQVNTARNDEAKRLTVSRLYFGIPVGSSGFWVDEAEWRKCIGEVSEQDIEGKKCFLSLDLSEKNDLTALGAVFKGVDDRLAAKLWYWTTPGGLERRSTLDRIPYKVYVEKGELSVTESAVIDYEFVAMQIKDLVSKHDVDSLTIDPSFWEKFRDACEKIGLKVWVYEGPEEPEGEGLKVVRHSQGTKVAFGERNLCMPHSITRLTDKVLTGDIVIETNRLTQYCAANTVIRTDAIGNQMFDKSRQRGRMDGMIALAMATGASEGVKVKANEPSIYENHGIRTV